jgi:acyl-CoA hydrolase
MRPVSLVRALDLLQPGRRVFVHAGPAESLTFAQAIRADPDRAAGVDFIGVFLPGINTTDYAALAPRATVTSTFVSAPFSATFRDGRTRLLPKSYSGMARYLRENPPDVAVLHVSPPGPDGRMALGINQDYAPLAARGAKQVLALVNPRMPAVRGEAGLLPQDCAAIVEIDEPLRPFPAARPSGTLASVGANAATLIGDGDTIQIGIGKVQSAILANLFDRKHLGLHSGMIDDAIAALIEKGVLDNSRKSHDRGIGVTGIAIGTEAALACAQRGDMRFRDAAYTHDAAVLKSQDNFVAINSALEVDLLGQCNVETLDGRQISGAGGFHDFMRGAAAARNGRSIVALPASAGEVSRIVPRLCAPGIATGPRNDCDIVVTEHGIARLRDLHLDARAQALIAIAAPVHRGALSDAWREMRERF